jgi:hypothetical protein
MDLNAVADEIAAVLDTIDPLRVSAYPPGTVSPPAGIVSFPQSVTFDETYARGMDRIRDWPVVVVVGRVTERTARDRIYEYASPTGAKSVKAVLEAHTWSALDVLRVASVEFDVVDIAAVDYIAAVFHLDIAGHGTA